MPIRNISKNARQRWPGVFLCLLISLSPPLWGECPTPRQLHWVELETVVDGDTLHAVDGSKLRLIAVNTPELGREGKPDQPLAREARRAVKRFLGEDRSLGLVTGRQATDRYGRRLVHVYRRDGQSLSEHLLRRGLGWRIAIPPNLVFQDCLTQAEGTARQAGRGVWSVAAFRPRPAAELTSADAGFARVSGTVQAVAETDSGWWVELEGISLRVPRRHGHYFAADAPPAWDGRRLIARGWIIDRSDSAAVRRHGYPPLMMVVSHPSMLSFGDTD